MKKDNLVTLVREARMQSNVLRSKLDEIQVHLDPRMRGLGLRLDTLSSRESEVVGLLQSAFPPKRIAKELDISVHTARNHIRSIYRKLGVHSRAELMMIL